jgi:methylaspartate ammonia-lyase
LKEYLLAAMGSAWWEQDDAIRAGTRYLGFRRTGSAIVEAFKSVINGLIRQGLLERDGSRLKKT